MNQSQIISAVKSILLFAGGYLVSRGLVTTDQLGTITADLVNAFPFLWSAATLVWGIYLQTTKNKIASTAALPEVTRIHTTPELADAIPAANVVASPG